jgi:hypothetical protein
MGEYGGVKYTLALDESELLASRLVSFSPGERAPRYPLNRRLGWPQRGLDAIEKRRTSCPYRELSPDS